MLHKLAHDLETIRIALFDDSADFREGIFHIIKMTEGLSLVGSFSNCNNVLENINETLPDVVLMDIDLPGISGIEAVLQIRKHHFDLNIIMLTVFEDESKIFESLRSGANGYLSKKIHPSKLLDAISEVQRGGAPMSEVIAKKVVHFFASQKQTISGEFELSGREKEVLGFLVNGYSYKMIASEMFISIETVRSHIKHIYDKLHVNSKTEAVIKSMKDHLL